MSTIKTFKALWHLPKLAKASHGFVEAWDQIARGNPENAERLFEDSENILRTIKCMKRTTPSTLDVIKKGYIKHKLKKYDESYALFLEAWHELDGSEKYNANEKNYLKKWMCRFLDFHRKHLGKEFDFEFLEMSDVDLFKVNKRLKRTFPMRNHPNWRIYGA